MTIYYTYNEPADYVPTRVWEYKMTPEQYKYVRKPFLVAVSSKMYLHIWLKSRPACIVTK